MSKELTEKWNKGKIPEDYYYIRFRSGNIQIRFIDSNGVVEDIADCYVCEIVAPVPNYEEYQALLSDQLAKNEGVEINAELEDKISKAIALIKDGRFIEALQLLEGDK